MIFDHSMTTLNLGFVTDLTQEHLDDGKERSKSDTDRTPLPKECPSCHYLRPPKVRECPACGFIAEHVPHDVKAAEGELIEVTPKTLNRKSTLAEKALFYGELRGYAQERGYNPKWADAKYREKFGTWPNDPRVRHAPARTPSRATRNWCKAQAIRWAKSQPKRAEEVRA